MENRKMPKKSYDYDLEGEVKLGSQTVDFYLGYDITEKGLVVGSGTWEIKGERDPGLYGSPEYLIDSIEVIEFPQWEIVHLEIFGMEMDDENEIDEFFRKTPGLMDQLTKMIEEKNQTKLLKEVEDYTETTRAYSFYTSDEFKEDWYDEDY
jgi:hypothetical protein